MSKEAVLVVFRELKDNSGWVISGSGFENRLSYTHRRRFPPIQCDLRFLLLYNHGG
jgi:hypothetical protein